MALDIVGPMPGKHNKKKYIITAINFATHWPVAQAVKAHTGNGIQCFIGKGIISKFGNPELLITNRGKELTSDDTNIYFTKNKVQHSVITPYHPQANGCVEHMNDSLVQALAKLTARRPEDWYKQKPTAQFVFQTRVNRFTGKSPFKLIYGAQPNIIQALSGPKLEMSSKVSLRLDPQVIQVNSDWLGKEKKCLQNTFAAIQDRHKVGDKVWVTNTDKSKLQPEKVGPAIILKVKEKQPLPGART
ncbi:hypothetical protein DSO57_1039602 [Entomophthora muscae]|uniref:Uncharacterized protein n=1 Tax=Entomophthora muscae TaxID=34485 RepID=A0ACC2SLL4_9FUNG|nr:hypothetical protein DSO57_1039602 [Entomophthora muscae]